MHIYTIVAFLKTYWLVQCYVGTDKGKGKEREAGKGERETK